jgi:hypothetical protein
MTDIYKQALMTGLRFQTTKGVLSTEDLMSLSISQLDAVYSQLSDEKDKRPRRSLLATKDAADNLDLQIAIVTDIVETKLAEQQAKQDANNKASQRQTILAVLASKQQSDLESKTPAELQAMLEAL